MAPEIKRHRKPAIIVTRTDHERPSRLAEAHAARNPEVSGELLNELDRARIVHDDKVGSNVVCMGSTLGFTSDLGEDRTVTLVFPGEADIAAGKVSILTPIGAPPDRSLRRAVNRLDRPRRPRPSPHRGNGRCAGRRLRRCRGLRGTAARIMMRCPLPCRLSLYGGCLIAG